MRISYSLPSGLKALAAALGLFAFSSAAQADPPLVEQVVLSGEGDRAEVRIQGTFDVPDYSIRARDGGRVVVVDVTGATLRAGGVRSVGSSRLVTSSTATTHSRGVRIELNMSEAARFHARARPGDRGRAFRGGSLRSSGGARRLRANRCRVAGYPSRAS